MNATNLGRKQPDRSSGSSLIRRSEVSIHAAFCIGCLNTVFSFSGLARRGSLK